jgi:hypothetical protein
MSETRRIRGVPSERGFVFLGGFTGVHPGLVGDAPSSPLTDGVGSVLDREVNKLPDEGMALETRWGRGSETSSFNLLNEVTHTSPMARHAPGGGHEHGIEIVILQLALKGHRIPAQGIALGTASQRIGCVLKEHRIRWAGVDVPDTESMRRSFQLIVLEPL